MVKDISTQIPKTPEISGFVSALPAGGVNVGSIIEILFKGFEKLLRDFLSKVKNGTAQLKNMQKLSAAMATLMKLIDEVTAVESPPADLGSLMDKYLGTPPYGKGGKGTKGILEELIDKITGGKGAAVADAIEAKAALMKELTGVRKAFSSNGIMTKILKMEADFNKLKKLFEWMLSKGQGGFPDSTERKLINDLGAVWKDIKEFKAYVGDMGSAAPPWIKNFIKSYDEFWAKLLDVKAGFFLQGKWSLKEIVKSVTKEGVWPSASQWKQNYKDAWNEMGRWGYAIQSEGYNFWSATGAQVDSSWIDVYTRMMGGDVPEKYRGYHHGHWVIQYSEGTVEIAFDKAKEGKLSTQAVIEMIRNLIAKDPGSQDDMVLLYRDAIKDVYEMITSATAMTNEMTTDINAGVTGANELVKMLRELLKIPYTQVDQSIARVRPKGK